MPARCVSTRWAAAGLVIRWNEHQAVVDQDHTASPWVRSGCRRRGRARPVVDVRWSRPGAGRCQRMSPFSKGPSRLPLHVLSRHVRHRTDPKTGPARTCGRGTGRQDTSMEIVRGVPVTDGQHLSRRQQFVTRLRRRPWTWLRSRRLRAATVRSTAYRLSLCALLPVRGGGQSCLREQDEIPYAQSFRFCVRSLNLKRTRTWVRARSTEVRDVSCELDVASFTVRRRPTTFHRRGRPE